MQNLIAVGQTVQA